MTASQRFALHVVALFGGEPTHDDPAWARFLDTAALDEAVLGDAEVERVATGPLRLLLTTAGARRFAQHGGEGERRFIVTLGGERLYAGRIVFVGTARLLRHPIMHVHDDGLATTLVILPELGARGDTARTAPPALLAHFADTRKLVPAGTPPSPRYRRRSWAVELASPRQGE